MTPAAQMEHEQLIESLRAAREKTLAKLGTVSKNVIGRDPNKYIAKYGDPRKFFWPSSVTGTIRLVWRENSVMLVTDGISDPWDKELHPAAPPGTFDYELAVEAPNHAFASLTEAAVFSSWMSGVLITTTDWMIAERVDLVGRLIKFDCATVTAPPIEGLESLLCPDGTLRGLIGIPPAGEVGMSLALTVRGKLPLYLLTIKIMTPDETAFALGDEASNAILLMNRFIQRGDRHLTWNERPSVLKSPGTYS